MISSLPANSDDNSKQCSHIMSKWSKDKLLPIQNKAFVMPSQVNYVVTGGLILEPSEKKIWTAQYYSNRQNYEVIL